MAADEELPATLTPQEGIASSDSQGSQGVQRPWGRLLSNRMFLPNVDLVDSSFSFGRSENCTLVLTKKLLTMNDANMFDNISKIHFKIFKNEEDNLIYIQDLSKNGTYINDKKLGKGMKCILKTGDVIYLFLPPKKFYVFQRTDGEELDKFLPIELSSKYAFIRQIGRGACGEVYLVKERESCQAFAIKKIIKSAKNTSQLDKINHPSKISNEINILRTLEHPNIIKMVEILEDDKVVYIILEFMAGGDLYPRIVDKNYDFPEELAKFYFYQMVLGVSYLHQEGMAHRDLKPENLLLLSEDQETVLKITDFGLSKSSENDDLTTMCGTLKYVAPEVICSSLRLYGEYGKPVDVWSLGVILHLMLSKTFPFDAPEKKGLREQIVTVRCTFEEDCWQGISKEAKDLVRRMLVPYPQKRIRIEEILRHKWISGDHPMRYRVHNLIQSHMPMLAIDFTAQEPPEKKFKFTVFSSTSNSDTDSGESEATIRCYDSF